MPVVRLVNLILIQAIRDCASDIHFEPFEDEFRIRYRIDGALYELTPPPRHLAHPIVSRLKVLANSLSDFVRSLLAENRPAIFVAKASAKR